MTTVEQLAAHWAKYWDKSTSGMLADNAPTVLWRFVLANQRYDREMIYDALVSIATARPVRMPETTKMLKWFSANPDAIASCDSVLKEAKAIPRSFAAIVEQGYKRELYSIVTDLTRFLTKEINQ